MMIRPLSISEPKTNFKGGGCEITKAFNKGGGGGRITKFFNGGGGGITEAFPNPGVIGEKIISFLKGIL